MIEKQVQHLLKEVNSSLEKACPKASGLGVSPRKQSRVNSWWSRDIEIAKSNCMKVKNVYFNWLEKQQKGSDIPNLSDTDNESINEADLTQMAFQPDSPDPDDPSENPSYNDSNDEIIPTQRLQNLDLNMTNPSEEEISLLEFKKTPYATDFMADLPTAILLSLEPWTQRTFDAVAALHEAPQVCRI